MIEGTVLFDVIIGIFEKLLIVITPAILAYISYKNSKREKNDIRYRDIKDELDKRIREERDVKDNNVVYSIDNVSAKLDSSISELNDRFDTLDETVDTKITELTTQFTKYQQVVDIDSINKQLNRLISLNEFTFQYSRSLSNIVNEMGGCIEDLSPTTNTSISAAISSHKDLEDYISSEMRKMIY